MAATSFEHAGEARAALQAIVSDPAYGPDVLSDPAGLSNLLSDYLPDAPRETGPLIAAAQADLAGMLRDLSGKGMDAATAIRITASALAARTAYSGEACTWVTGELAIALGLATPQSVLAVTTVKGAPAIPPAAEPAEAAAVPTAPRSGQPADSRVQEAAREQLAPAGQQPKRRRRAWLAAAVGLTILVLAAGGLLLQHLHSAGHRPQQAGGPPGPGPDVSIGQFFGRRPAVIDFSADGASAVTGIIWSSWNASGATGTGTWDHETCVPDCASGPVRTYPATLRFSDVRNGVFTVLSTRWNGQASTWYYPDGRPQQASSTVPAGPSQSPVSPTAVVEAYIAAVNQRDWPKVWRLGGKNLSPSYGQMVAGYRLTRNVVIKSLTTRGDEVTVRALAYETTGAVQTYLLQYTVPGGIIIAGSSNLLRTSG